MRRATVEERRDTPWFDRRREDAVAGDGATDPSFTEYEVGTILRVVGIDGHIGGSGGEHRQDRHVELARARLHPDAHPIATTHTHCAQAGSDPDDPGRQLAIAQGSASIVERGGLGMPPGRLSEDVEQGAWLGSEV